MLGSLWLTPLLESTVSEDVVQAAENELQTLSSLPHTSQRLLKSRDAEHAAQAFLLKKRLAKVQALVAATEFKRSLQGDRQLQDNAGLDVPLPFGEVKTPVLSDTPRFTVVGGQHVWLSGLDWAQLGNSTIWLDQVCCVGAPIFLLPWYTYHLSTKDCVATVRFHCSLA